MVSENFEKTDTFKKPWADERMLFVPKTLLQQHEVTKETAKSISYCVQTVGIYLLIV